MKEWTLVTGAAKGLGEEICRSLAKNGIPVILHYNTSENAALTIQQQLMEQGADVEIIQGDFSTAVGTKEFTERLLALNLPIKNIINNVGNYFIGSLLNTSVEEWESLFQTNTHAPFMIIKALSSSVRKFTGSVINIGVAGVNNCCADVYSPAYTLSKTALLGLTKSLAKELAADHVTVNMVSPGHLENSVDLPKNINKIPMKRPASFEEVTDMILFLISDKGRYITGQNIEVAGGIRI
ncbi:MAG: SDR family oxidoreductase [Chlamydiota bacterium]|nr:SDR family oxidoreductase [Chlamydiota bacterium]